MAVSVVFGPNSGRGQIPKPIVRMRFIVSWAIWTYIKGTSRIISVGPVEVQGFRLPAGLCMTCRSASVTQVC